MTTEPVPPLAADPIAQALGLPVELGEAVQALDERVRAVDVRVRRFVMERPVVAIAGAVAAGFLIGRLLSR